MNTDKFQELFNYLNDELGAIALETQMQEIVRIANKIWFQEDFENQPDDCAHPSDAQYIKTIAGSCTCVTTVTACRLCGAHLTEPETNC